ncbi:MULTISPECIES: response regulator transcription factor [unclassified Rhizobium]|uniref:response regulator transcription factor n=1 Tax=unclassified Rhizobium TaxID=2613769 RepID=UPI0016072EE3|nr:MULTISPECIES: response regulator transcription factor [unclassified Rhizobium]MBB3289464.1 DNA-binding response OmpR family regulator [Rhizobium sp. BK252]MBB3404406.1 DNA-binding response OmpR family regulator [Rhizobium sp. BK289]MBB3416792.1 DNA-binding response OmpR family regulator [Rhizobium sp. BK284]MBB3484669.1 DNA-binding response OmpR family regulator [Rhizobium sp. BK347]MDK4722888.1 response regulator transcription factor [Rhizobium sp. CNPSo 3968]
MAKVLLIDDDTELTTLLSEYLVEEGFQVETSEDARVGIAGAADQSVDIIVLDVMMPRMNGIDALQRIRRLGNVPVLMLTAKGDDIDRISGLNLGADDYVAKPCSPGELVARIRAILRRAGSRLGDENILQVGDLALYPTSRTAQWQGKPLELTGAEFNILEVLARNAGQLVPKQEISRRAFGRPLTPFDRRIDVHISSVRQKLGSRDDGTSWIHSIRGQGYQLVQGL